MKQIFISLLAVAALSGCSTQSSLTPAMQADLVRPIYCEGASECKTMWKRALHFVNLNAGHKILKANAALIETRESYGSSKALSMRVTKVPLGGGRHQLKIFAWCTHGFGTRCAPNKEETLWRAQLFIREGKE